MTTMNDVYSAKKAARAAMEAYYAACRAVKVAKQKRYDDLANMIAQFDRPVTSNVIAERTNGDFTRQSIEQLARWAEFKNTKRRYMISSCPQLQRVKVHKVRRFAEIDEDGNIIPDTIREHDSSHYEYFVNG